MITARLKNTRTSCPSSDVVLKERREFFGSWRQLSASVSDLVEIEGHHRIYEADHHDLAVAACRETKRWYDGDSLARLYHRNLSVESIEHHYDIWHHMRLREIFVDQLLYRTARPQ
jgi:hypothetical protein